MPSHRAVYSLAVGLRCGSSPVDLFHLLCKRGAQEKLPSPLHWPEPCFTATAAACILRGPPRLLACPAHPARTHLTAPCAHHAHHCRSAPPRRLRRRPRPVKLRRPPLLAVMRSTVVSALSASFRLLMVPSSVSLFPPAAVTQCIWSAWRSIAHKLMARRTCFARCVATADARSAHMEGGPLCMTNTCGRYVAGKACPCRSGFRAKSPCGKLSKTTNAARAPPTMRPNPERHQGSPSFAATGSRPWAARAGSNSFDCRTARCSGRPSLSGLTLA